MCGSIKELPALLGGSEAKDKIIKILASELAHRAKGCPQTIEQQSFCDGKCKYAQPGKFNDIVRDCWIAWATEEAEK
jgi:hypothetical protein